MTIQDIPDGIYQTAELVDRFKKILFGMNKQNENVMFKQNKNNNVAFPFNELHPSSPFSNMIDWEDSIKQLFNKDEDRGQNGKKDKKKNNGNN